MELNKCFIFRKTILFLSFIYLFAILEGHENLQIIVLKIEYHSMNTNYNNELLLLREKYKLVELS